VVYRHIFSFGAAVLAGMAVSGKDGVPREPELRQWASDHVFHAHYGWRLDFSADSDNCFFSVYKDIGFSEHQKSHCSSSIADIERLIVTIQYENIVKCHQFNFLSKVAA
jgi:hypothetical protein